MNRQMVAKELVLVAKELAAAELLARDADPDFKADPDAVDALAAKLLSRLSSQVKSRSLRQYGIDLKSTDKVEALFKAVATVYSAG